MRYLYEENHYRVMTKICVIIFICLICGSDNIKARTLYAKYEPALSHNDFAVCNSAAAFKNGSPFDEMLSFINQTTNEYPDTSKQIGKISLDDEFTIYPNPVDNELRIWYQFIDSKTRIFVLYDMLGRKLLQSELTPLQKEIIIQTSQLQVGLYSYQVVYEGSQSLSGKITIAR